MRPFPKGLFTKRGPERVSDMMDRILFLNQSLYKVWTLTSSYLYEVREKGDSGCKSTCGDINQRMSGVVLGREGHTQAVYFLYKVIQLTKMFITVTFIDHSSSSMFTMDRLVFEEHFSMNSHLRNV